MSNLLQQRDMAVVGGVSLLKLRKNKQGPYTGEDFLYFQLAFLMLVVYTAVALTPFPPYDQYFDSPLVPFRYRSSWKGCA